MFKPIIVAAAVLGSVWTARSFTQCSTFYCYLLHFSTYFTVLGISYAIYHVILYPYYLSPLRHLPGVEQPPVWGRLMREPNMKMLVKWMNEVPNNGLIRYHGLFNQERIFVTTTQGCKEVLQTHAYDYIKLTWALEVMGMVTRLGVLVAPPKKHKVDRKLLQPAFKVPYVKSLYPVFWSETTKFITMIESKLPDHETGILDIGNLLHYVTLDIVTLTGFGGSLNAVGAQDSEKTEQFRNILSAKRSHIKYRLLGLIMPFWIFRNLPVQARKEIIAAKQYVSESIRPLIQERRRSARLPTKDDGNLHGQGDIIATLLRSGNTFSDQYLIDQAIGFMIAGQETTAVAVTFVLYLLSANPEMQTRLRRDIRASLASPDVHATVDTTDIESIPYLTAVCNEALRLYSPVPDTRREVIAPQTEVEGTIIPNGTVVVAASWAIHRSKAVWGPDADEFNPERWFVPGSNGTKIDPLGGCDTPYGNMIFTYGARACIGERFARGEMLTLVAQLVGRFDWKFKGIGAKGDRELRLSFGVTLAPVGGGMTMYVRKVDGW